MTTVHLTDDDFDFIVKYDPDRERVASRAVLVAVLQHIQDVIAEGAHHPAARRHTPIEEN